MIFVGAFIQISIKIIYQRGLGRTYWSGNYKAGEDIPNGIECCRDYRGYIAVWCHGDGHHAVEGEVHEREEHEEEIPEEFLGCPVEANETVDDESVYDSLKENVWNLNKNLHAFG